VTAERHLPATILVTQALYCRHIR